MSDYSYFIAAFQEIDAEFLRQMIVSIPGLVATFVVLNTTLVTINSVDGANIVVTFSSPLSAPNQATLDAIIAGYMTSVPIAKAKKLSALQTASQNFIDTHYSFLIRTQLINLYTLAKFDGLVNRAAYIRPGIDWLNTITAYASTSMTAINALTNLADIQSYVIDVAGNVGSDPLLTVGAAISISN